MKKILIIENNAEIRENTAELLELNSFAVVTAETGCAGFETAKKFLPDVIICDIAIAKPYEGNFLNLIKTETAINNIPLIYLSDGLLQPGLQRRNGTDLYLTKPFTEEKLVMVITKALESIKS